MGPSQRGEGCHGSMPQARVAGYSPRNILHEPQLHRCTLGARLYSYVPQLGGMCPMNMPYVHSWRDGASPGCVSHVAQVEFDTLKNLTWLSTQDTRDMTNEYAH